MTSRSDIVVCARTWIDTPFHHLARSKGTGVDCAGVLIGVGRELGLVAPDFDVPAYSRQPDGVSLLRWCREYMTEQPFEALAPGMAILVEHDVRPQHLGITGDYWHGEGLLTIIHAAEQAPVSRVIEMRLMFHARMRFVAAFDFPGIEA